MKRAFAICFAAALASSAPAAPVRVGPVEAELVPAVESIAPGQPFTIAFRMKLDAPWHTYWINPGDSGLAPTLVWSLPEGFSAGKLEFPPPTAIPTPPFMTYGLEGEVWFLTTITPPAHLPPGDIVLAAEAEWLICHGFCLPGGARLERILPGRATAPEPHPLHAARIAAARDLLPTVPPDWRFHARAENRRFLLSAFPPPDFADAIPAAAFFPFDPERIRHAAPQTWRRDGNGFVLDLVPADPAAPPPAVLAGVLVLDFPDSRRAFRVAASFSEAASPRPSQTERNTP
ncbi:MAG: hypothetical protein EOM72_10705 [Opitutae bacterium]|nr:hypothetical protein [Opitutae bacterium]